MSCRTSDGIFRRFPEVSVSHGISRFQDMYSHWSRRCAWGGCSSICPQLVWALYVFVNGFMTIALLAIQGVLTDTPCVFPSLGPLPISSSSHHSELHLVRGTQF